MAETRKKGFLLGSARFHIKQVKEHALGDDVLEIFKNGKSTGVQLHPQDVLIMTVGNRVYCETILPDTYQKFKSNLKWDLEEMIRERESGGILDVVQSRPQNAIELRDLREILEHFNEIF